MIPGPSVLAEVIASLDQPRHTFSEAMTSVAGAPGLYAFHAEASTWRDLGLGEPPDGRPLYVGKAERSLRSRDVLTHFGTGKTGSSTVRRSLASLLCVDLELKPCPRNLATPDGSASFALEPQDDERLTTWMCERLTLAVWETEPGLSLVDVESDVIKMLAPPLNIAKARTPWRAMLQSRRAAMAAASRAWRPTP